MSELKTKIRYNGEVIATLDPGDRASVNCKDDIMEDDITIEVGTGGSNINGVVRDYIVNAGESISAGDFVEFVNKLGDDEFADTITGYYISAFLLSESKAIIVWVEHGYTAYAAVVSLTSSGLTVGNSFTIVSSNQSELYLYFTTTKVSNTKVLVGYNESNLHRIRTLLISGTNITAGGEFTSSFNSLEGRYALAALTENRAILAEVRGKITLLNTSDTTPTVIMTKTFGTNFIPNYAIDKILVLSENNVLLSSVSDMTNSTCLTPLFVDDSNMTCSTWAYGIFNYETSDHHPIAYISTENKIVLARKGKFSETISIYIYDADDMYNSRKAVSIPLNGVTLSSHSRICVFPGNRLLCVFHNNTTNGLSAMMIRIIGEDASAGAQVNFDDGEMGSYDTFDLIPLDNNSVLITRSDGKCESLTIIGMNVFVDSDHPEGYAQTATTDDTYLGVAKTSGIEGETIEVYRVQ